MPRSGIVGDFAQAGVERQRVLLFLQPGNLESIPHFQTMKTTRREFLRNSTIAGLGLGLFGSAAASGGLFPAATESFSANSDIGATRPRPAGQKSVHDLTTKPLDNIRVAFIGCGGRGTSLLHDALSTKLCTVTAVCDLRKERAENAAKAVKKKAGNDAVVYGGAEDSWEEMVKRDDIDVVIIATPWEWHVPNAVGSMNAGKHAFVEVAAAVTVDQCWQLVDTSERTQKHCVMLENCCYGENELFVLNMARKGVFGELTHAECAYIHNLRDMLFQLGTEGDWRREYHRKINGNLYPTHGLGPVAQYMGINRGDQFKFLVSVSSPEIGLTKWRNEKNPNGGRHAHEKYVTGDMNTSIIKTELGRTIMIQHDIISPRPYSRINALSGTGATFFDYPDKLAVDEPRQYGLSAHPGAHSWLGDKDMQKMREQFTHPLINRLKEQAKGAGHGGMDFVMMYRHLECIKNGTTPDSTAYDAASWSCILELSARSVTTGSCPVAIPDFTRGIWKTMSPLAIIG